MEKHVTFIAILNIALGLFGVIAAIVLFFIIAGSGMLGGMLSRELPPILITGAVGTAIAMMIMIFSVPGIIGGIGLMHRKPWARILMLIIAILNLVNIPFGTVIGIYTIWVMMQDETVRMFTVY